MLKGKERGDRCAQRASPVSEASGVGVPRPEDRRALQPVAFADDPRCVTSSPPALAAPPPPAASSQDSGTAAAHNRASRRRRDARLSGDAGVLGQAVTSFS